MAITLYPTKRAEYVKETGIITKVSTDNSEPITINRDILVIYEFDTSALSVYGRTNNPRVPLSIIKRPTSDSYSYWLYFYKKVNFSFEVGNVVEIPSDYFTYGDFDSHTQWQWAWFTQYIAPNEENKFYMTIVFQATDWDGNIGHPTEDQTFKFSGLSFTADVQADIPFVIQSSFAGGYQNPNDDLIVHASPVYNTYGIKQYILQNAVLHYKKHTDQIYTDITSTGFDFVIPSGTLENGTEYEVYLSGSATNGSTSQTAVASLTTIDGTGTATAISPYNEITYGDINFVWDYSVSTGADQYAYDLQISTDNGTTWSDLAQHVVTASTSVQHTQATTGETLWRVRCYNQNDVAGSWSNSRYYINNVPPQPPVISSVSGNGRKTVSWSTSQQVAYEMQVISDSSILVYETGEVYSTAKNALINEYLENGQYTVKVRVAAGYGKWSTWGTLQINVTASLSSPVFTVGNGSEGAQLFITAAADYDHFYILRNGSPIAKTEGGNYVDRFASGDITYKVIGVGSDDSYGYATQTIRFIPSENYLILPNGETFTCSRRWGERVLPSRNTIPEMAAFNFYGASSPTHIISKKMRTVSFNIVVYDENGALDNFLGTPVFITTVQGWSSWCVIRSINRQEQVFGNGSAITMESDSYNLEIEYDL